MSTPFNYTPATATGDTATVVVPIAWPFSNTITDLNVIQENTTTGEITRERDGDFTVSVDPGGASITATNFYGAGTEITVTVYRQTNITQEYGQSDGEALDFYALVAQLDKMVREAQEDGTASTISITDADKNYLLTVDSSGNIVISKMYYDPATGILEVMDDDKLTLAPGVGFSGFDFKVDGETDAATFELTGDGGSLVRSAKGTLTTDVSDTEHNISATLLNFFKEDTGESRAVRIWGGAAGTDRYAELKISESTDLRAVFGGDITQWDFTGNIYINGVALTTAATAVGGAANLTTQYRGVFVDSAGKVTESSSIKTNASGDLLANDATFAGNVTIQSDGVNTIPIRLRNNYTGGVGNTNIVLGYFDNPATQGARIVGTHEWASNIGSGMKLQCRTAPGVLTDALILDTDSNATVAGTLVAGTPIVTESGTTKTLAITDRAAIVRMTNAGSITVTIPTNAAVAFSVGDVVVVRQSNGAVTITGDTGVTVNGVSAGSGTMTTPVTGQVFDVMLQKVAADEWEAIGATAAFA